MALRRTSIEKLIKKHRVRHGKARLPERVGRFFLRVIKLCCIVVLVALLFGTGYVARRFFIPRYFELKEIVIRNVSPSLHAEICELARLKPNAGINLLFLRASSVRQAVLKHPRIASATVAKCYPN
ncbi:FtsQ-type POTRA domain-containing protein, partial [Candidatus Sumerlaeota bacterium]|nr:FtsQ-type POTRA domain-containing protein [Candidatus Sumerlaeota bacterium]